MASKITISNIPFYDREIKKYPTLFMQSANLTQLIEYNKANYKDERFYFIFSEIEEGTLPEFDSYGKGHYGYGSEIRFIKGIEVNKVLHVVIPDKINKYTFQDTESSVSYTEFNNLFLDNFYFTTSVMDSVLYINNNEHKFYQGLGKSMKNRIGTPIKATDELEITSIDDGSKRKLSLSQLVILFVTAYKIEGNRIVATFNPIEFNDIILGTIKQLSDILYRVNFGYNNKLIDKINSAFDKYFDPTFITNVQPFKTFVTIDMNQNKKERYITTSPILFSYLIDVDNKLFTQHGFKATNIDLTNFDYEFVDYYLKTLIKKELPIDFFLTDLTKDYLINWLLLSNYLGISIHAEYIKAIYDKILQIKNPDNIIIQLQDNYKNIMETIQLGGHIIQKNYYAEYIKYKHKYLDLVNNK